ncbi:MAG: carotenoid oxygenase family protein, partial [Candidatus Nanopelagicales bacterium]
MITAPAPVNPADYPFLSGCFAPIDSECDRRDLEVVAGEIPLELNGTYMRNGGNPRFTPLGGFVYPFEGDAMVHAVHLADGTASYRNRFIRTPALEARGEGGPCDLGE